MHSVNVVVILNNAVKELLAYPDTTEGNEKAEVVFVGMIKEYYEKNLPARVCTEADMESFLEEGIYEMEDLDSMQPVRTIGSICITHSMNEEDTH